MKMLTCDNYICITMITRQIEKFTNDAFRRERLLLLASSVWSKRKENLHVREMHWER